MLDIVYANESDFDYVYKLSSKNSKLLGFVHPMEIRDAISKQKIIISKLDGEVCGFCIFNPLKKNPSMLTVQIICVDDNFRGNGIGKAIIEFLKKTYRRNIKATCVKDTTSELFWQKVAKKYEELPGKQRPICRYIIENTTSSKLF